MMNFLKNSKGTIITDERVLTYWQVLKEYPDEYVKGATFNCVKKHDYFPTISQIVREFEACDEEAARQGSYVKKIEAPRNVRKDLVWIRQTLVLLSCKGNQNKNHLKLYSDEELEDIVDKEEGNKKLLREMNSKPVINKETGEVIVYENSGDKGLLEIQ
jgi:hypothetical protein